MPSSTASRPNFHVVPSAVPLVTAPVVTHALAQAALHERTEPLLSEDRRKAKTEGASGRPQ